LDIKNWRRLEDDLRTLIASGFDLEHYNLLEENAPTAPYTPTAATIGTELAIQQDSHATTAAYKQPRAEENPSPRIPVVGIGERITSEATTPLAKPRSVIDKTEHSAQACEKQPVVELLRNLLRESPKKFKDLYPIIAERHPEHCPAQGTKVSFASMAWLNQLQHDLQQIATNRDGIWHLKDGPLPQTPIPATLRGEQTPEKVSLSLD
jgi:hypothetical protein